MLYNVDERKVTTMWFEGMEKINPKYQNSKEKETEIEEPNKENNKKESSK